MLKENQLVQMKWSNANKKHYMELGYKFTKIGDYLEVKAEDLSVGSHMVVTVVCDYCGNEFEREYVSYIKFHNKYGDACCNCAKYKQEKTMYEKYGVRSPYQVEEFKQKGKTTILEKYGVDNISQLDEIKEKKKQTCFEHYGVCVPLQSNEVMNKMIDTNEERYGVPYTTMTQQMIEKTKETCMKKYGVDNASKSDVVKELIRNNTQEKYGVENVMYVPEIRKKIVESFYKNGTAPTSSIQIYVSNLVKKIYGDENVFDNVPLEWYCLDIVLNYKGYKIDIEYDGWYWHKNKIKEDTIRNKFVTKQGYKILRIRSNEELPNEQQIIDAVNYLIEENHHLTYIDLDIQDEDIV